MPGPGNYEEKSFITEGIKYSMYQKREETIEQTPGPGDYEEVVEKKEGITIGQKLKDKDIELLPGPGNYEERSYILDGPQYSIHQRRDERIEQTPGPGDYEEIEIKKEGYTIGQKLTEKEAEEIPGPGNYEGKTYITDGVKYSMYQRRDERIEQTPGPGDYEDIIEKKGGIIIGQKLTEKEAEEIPGPGNYEERNYITDGAKYSIYQRRDERIEQTPGPGDYEDIEEKSKGIIIAERLNQKEAEEIPGPGNYEEKIIY